MPSLEEQLREYGSALTTSRRPVDVDAVVDGESRLEPQPPPSRSRVRRPVAVAAAVVVLVVAGVAVVRTRSMPAPAVDLLLPATPGDPAALHDLRQAADATVHASSFTMTVSYPTGESRNVYQAPDRVHQVTTTTGFGQSPPPVTTGVGPVVTPPGLALRDGNSLPSPSIPDPEPVPSSSSLESIFIGSTVYTADPSGGWSSQVLSGPIGTGAGLAGGVLDILRSATSASSTGDGFRWTAQGFDGTAVVRDGYFVEVVLHRLAGPTYSNDPNHPTGTAPEQTTTIRFTDINSSPPVNAPPDDQVHPTPPIAICPPARDTPPAPCLMAPTTTR